MGEVQAERRSHHYDAAVTLPAWPEDVFAELDVPARLSSHMTRRSWMMLGSSMSIEPDARGGQAQGSMVKLGGRVLGIRLYATVRISERQPPLKKVWESVGEPQLLVIGGYRMGFEIGRNSALGAEFGASAASGCGLRVFIAYARPTPVSSQFLSMLLGSTYARWCVNQMLKDASVRFSRGPATHVTGVLP